MTTIHILNVSGGKDSTALLLWAMERGIDFKPVYADTGNEHPITLDYVRRLPEMTGCPEIRWVKADFSEAMEGRRKRLPDLWRKDGISEEKIQQALTAIQPTGNPFYDLCLLKGRFPSTKARFCSQELKTMAIHEYVIEPLLSAGHTVVSILGIRADESRQRGKRQEFEDLGDGRIVWCPLLKWTWQQVFEILKHHAVDPNPLYKTGMERVGCMPCIHERKSAILNISQRWPEQIERIREWEMQVSRASKRNRSTFFAVDKTPGPHQQDHSLDMPGIDAVVEWSKTGRGGWNLDMFADEPPPACESPYQLCDE